MQRLFENTILKELQALELNKNCWNTALENWLNNFLSNKNARMIITGIGKSAIIGNKMAATLLSTGIESHFMHAAEAVHGDIGIIKKDDFVFLISNSGNTPELKLLLPYIKQKTQNIALLTSNENAFLAKEIEVKVVYTYPEEADSANIVPTVSTTVQLAICDAICIALIDKSGFTSERFMLNHPGGMLGKSLSLRVEDIMEKTDVPTVNANDNIKDIIVSISSHKQGATIVKEGDEILGIITDGDLRRMIETNPNFMLLRAKELMSTNPTTISSKSLVVEALDIIRKKKITQLIVSENNKLLGLVHIHQILKEGF